jgi:hypothetical protein
MRSLLDLSSLLQEAWSFDPQGSVYSNRSLIPGGMRSLLDLSSLLQEAWSFDPQGSVYSNRSLIPGGMRSLLDSRKQERISHGKR